MFGCCVLVDRRVFAIGLAAVLISGTARAEEDLPPPAPTPADELPYTSTPTKGNEIPTPAPSPMPPSAPEAPVAPAEPASEETGSASSVSASAPSKPAPAKKPARKKPVSQKGMITAEIATIFREPNFDSEVMATARPKQVFDISIGKRGPFYKIRLKPGVTGWISDAEVKPMGQVSSRSQTKRAKTAKAEPAKRTPPPKSKPFHLLKHRGLGLEFINFTEDTMGKVRNESLIFYGYRFSGENTLTEGMYTDAEILFHFGAPGYYEDATGRGADGLIMLGNFMFVTTVPQSRNVMAYYGFGPMFRFSQFRTELLEKGKYKGYELTDVNLGAVFGLGIGVAIGDRYAVRLDGKYYWETQRYTSFGLAFQVEF